MKYYGFGSYLAVGSWKCGLCMDKINQVTDGTETLTGYQLPVEGSYLNSFLHNNLKTTQLIVGAEPGSKKPVARLKEPRDLYALQKEFCPQQAPRWPCECQVLPERVTHIEHVPHIPELYYKLTGREPQPKPVGEEMGEVVFQYYPLGAVNYFSRACVGGARYLTDVVPPRSEREFSPETTLRFESRFESGNLSKVIKISETYYELYLRSDLYTSRHTQWFYFRIENMRKYVNYRICIVNLNKPDSLYNCGMRPLLYSERDAREKGVGWRRCGDNISYYRNDCPCEDEELATYTLTFNIEFPHDNDVVYMAHCFPYTYSDLQDFLMQLQNDPYKSTFCKLRLLCRTLAGNNVYVLTITAPPNEEEVPKRKQAIVLTARVHPGETPSSWMMKGFIEYLTSKTEEAKDLRERFIFKLVPMLNPDGVIVGNYRCSLTGRDLNRQYRTVIRETYPSIWHTKLMIRRLLEDHGILMYCDMHGHSRKHNIFIYGCESRKVNDRRLQEQVFPLMLHKNAADKFSFENCKFKIQRSKEGTGRVVVWAMGVANSYTMEASFGGTTLGSRTETHFHVGDYESMGRHFCETLLDFCDPEPSKFSWAQEKLRDKIINRLQKEGSSADEPMNIDLSDYSSDDNYSSSSCSDVEEDSASDMPRNSSPPTAVSSDTAISVSSPVSPADSPILRPRAVSSTNKMLKEPPLDIPSPKMPRAADRILRRPLACRHTTVSLSLPSGVHLSDNVEGAFDIVVAPPQLLPGKDAIGQRISKKEENKVKVEKIIIPPELIVTRVQTEAKAESSSVPPETEKNDFLKTNNILPKEPVLDVKSSNVATETEHGWLTRPNTCKDSSGCKTYQKCCSSQSATRLSVSAGLSSGSVGQKCSEKIGSSSLSANDLCPIPRCSTSQTQTPLVEKLASDLQMRLDFDQSNGDSDTDSVRAVDKFSGLLLPWQTSLWGTPGAHPLLRRYYQKIVAIQKRGAVKESESKTSSSSIKKNTNHQQKASSASNVSVHDKIKLTNPALREMSSQKLKMSSIAKTKHRVLKKRRSANKNSEALTKETSASKVVESNLKLESKPKKRGLPMQKIYGGQASTNTDDDGKGAGKSGSKPKKCDRGDYFSDGAVNPGTSSPKKKIKKKKRSFQGETRRVARLIPSTAKSIRSELGRP